VEFQRNLLLKSNPGTVSHHVVVLRNQTQMEQQINRYLIRAKELNVVPNFFMSTAYLVLSGVIAKEDNGWLWLEDGGQLVLPPLPVGDSLPGELPILPIWASFPRPTFLSYLNENYRKVFLDYQYIFDPKSFLNMTGGKWETFRKNSRKFQRDNGGWTYGEMVFPKGYWTQPTLKKWINHNIMSVRQLLGGWLEERMETVEDGQILADFALLSKRKDIHRKFLYHKEEIIGINAWDENYMYINYRVCIVKPGVPYLAEFMRWLFYFDPEIQNRGNLVNDGGSVGIPTLSKFKEKMNPVGIEPIYTLIKKYDK
jgi:hypothetical protein